MAQTGFNDLLDVQYSDEKAINVLPKLIIPLKNALVCYKILICLIFIFSILYNFLRIGVNKEFN